MRMQPPQATSFTNSTQFSLQNCNSQGSTKAKKIFKASFSSEKRTNLGKFKVRTAVTVEDKLTRGLSRGALSSWENEDVGWIQNNVFNSIELAICAI